MSGNVFKSPDGSALTTKIKREEIPATLTKLEQILREFGIEEIATIGSAGKKAESGDLDIAVGPVMAMDDDERQLYKQTLRSNLASRLGAENVALVGDNVHLRFPIAGRESEGPGDPDHVQIDLMLSQDPSNTAWLMAGTGTGLKGVFRNLLLAFIAKVRSIQTGKTYTLKYPGGIQVLNPDGEVVVKRTEVPQTILDQLMLNARPDDLLTFDDLLAVAERDPEIRQALRQGIPTAKVPDFIGYVSRYTKNDINSYNLVVKALGPEATIRESIQQILHLLR
jgi:hypothetical protein